MKDEFTFVLYTEVIPASQLSSRCAVQLGKGESKVVSPLRKLVTVAKVTGTPFLNLGKVTKILLCGLLFHVSVSS